MQRTTIAFFRFPKLLNGCKIWIANAKLANSALLIPEYCYKNLLLQFSFSRLTERTIQSEIEEIDESQFDSNERDEFEDKYFLIEARFTQAISSLEIHTARDSVASTTGADILKLAKIELPKFSGAYEDRLSFYNTFSSLIHNNDNIPMVQKFHYLKSCLKGEATNVIHSLEISADNYQTAWQMLQEKYSNQRIIIQKHINAIFELPIVAKENATTLRLILDGVLKHTRASAALKRPTEHWDDLLIVILTKKLDHHTLKEWETKIKSTQIPTFKEMISFLTQKCQTLETLSKFMKTNINETSRLRNQRAAINVAIDEALERTTSISCIYCKMQNHGIYNCKKFLALQPSRRLREIQSMRCCVNCLKADHPTTSCRSKHSCKTCYKKHNSLLHIGSERAHIRCSSPQPGTSSSIHSCNVNNSIVLLSTPLINVKDKRGRKRPCRVLDGGSQSNLITQKMANYLGLQRKPINITLTDITQARTQITQAIDVSIASRCTAFEAKINCLVLDKISENLPPISISQQQVRQMNIPRNLKSSDPGFNTANDVGMLIGVELFYKLLCIGQINLSQTGPCLQKTVFGWIVSGRITAPQLSTNLSVCNSATLQLLNKNINKFWEIETVLDRQAYSQEEKLCEQHFNHTAQRDAEGLFVVSLPFKEDVNVLGSSYDQAIKRFYSLERKLNKNPSLKREYVLFMNEYVELGHMRRMNANNCNTETHFYLPHHAVFKENSLTKVRVVFDGSAKTTTGISLNDVLMVGPKLQQDFFDIVCRFRLHKYALTGDVTKMYRQDFYVDDLLTGADNEGDVRKIIAEVTDILSRGKFELRKWASNRPELLKHILNSSNDNTILDSDKTEGINTLGLQWNTNADTFQYSITEIPKTKTVSKRQVLSHIFKIFDPLGLLDWDESLPLNIQETWLSYIQEIRELNKVKMPRRVISIDEPKHFELHGFCDASERACGACVYIRAVSTYDNSSYISDWYHINTKENPADLLSRGTSPAALTNSSLWWHGPEFLKFGFDKWPIFEQTQIENLPEVKVTLVKRSEENSHDIFQRYSNLNQLKRVIAYCLRFKNNVKSRIDDIFTNIETGYLTSTELYQAMKVLIILAQKEGFSNEYKQLQNASNRYQKQIIVLWMKESLELAAV
ncbi:hypothetical protein Trydic_g4591 [Trypoxylus dichotomus]